MLNTGKIKNIVDLHGLSVAEAQDVIEYWLSSSASKGIDQIRFVTGRGNHTNAKGEKGTLYKNFLDWIEKSPFKDRIERCDQHDGYFEVVFKSTQKQHPLTDFFKTAAQQFITANIEIVKTQAEKGKVYFQMYYAKLLEDGEGVTQDFKQAAKFYRLAAENNHAPAMHELARCYFHGVGVKQNNITAVKWLEKADKLGYIESTLSLGDSYWLGNGVKEDDKAAVSYYAKAAVHQHPVAMQKLANAYNQGTGVTKSVEAAFKWYKKAADLGDVMSQYNVGIMYQSGLGVKEDNKEAWRYLLMAAEGGDPDAQYTVGSCYLLGKSTVKDQTNAINWLKKAAVNGSKQAIHQLSLIGDEESKKFYLKKSAEAGNFIDKMRLCAPTMNEEEYKKLFTEEMKKNSRLPIEDIILLDNEAKFGLLDWMLLAGKIKYKEKALQAIESLAEEKCIFSLRRLAMFYAGGFAEIHIKKDINKAIKYVQTAIDLGDTKSMVDLGDLYIEGKEVKQSLPDAFALNEKAAKLLNPIACYNMAVFYFNGDVVSRDFEKARLYSAAAVKLEREEKIIPILKSGIMDKYIPIGKKARELFIDTMNIISNLEKTSLNDKSTKEEVEEDKQQFQLHK